MSSGTYAKIHGTTVITVDPPYVWDDKLPGDRGADEHMHPKTIQELCRTPLPAMGNDAVLFLWRPASRLSDALQIMNAWDFNPKTELVWLKTTTTGKRAFGMGRIVRGEHEICMVGTRGKPQVSNKSIRSTFSAPIVPYGKPPEFYDLVAELYPNATWYDRTNKAWSQGWKRYTEARKLANAR